jgi:penicillin V acylase-like amidase (Ntn superfamily)
MKMIILAVISVLGFRETDACTIFSLASSTGDQQMVGRNFDWEFDHGLVMINKRNVAKTSAVNPPDTPVQWASRYGSVTFNQVGREFPVGGMNEKGLMVEVLWLNNAQYPPADTRPAANELQWVQYQLDRYATVAEVLEALNASRISQIFARLHYFVCDPSGTCATIEPLQGRMVVHSGPQLPLAVLANNTYEQSVNYANRYLSSDTCETIPTDGESLNRFALASCRLKKLPLPRYLEVSFAILQEVAQGFFTKWSIVYDLKKLAIHWRTEKIRAIKFLQLKDFDFSCRQAVKTLEINEPQAGDSAGKFAPYRPQDNRRIAELSLLDGFAQLPLEVIDRLAQYPETTRCQEKN